MVNDHSKTCRLTLLFVLSLGRLDALLANRTFFLYFQPFVQTHVVELMLTSREHLEEFAFAKITHADSAVVRLCPPFKPHLWLYRVYVFFIEPTAHMSRILLHLEQLLVCHTVNVWAVWVGLMLLTTCCQGHAHQSFFFLLGMVFTGLHHCLHHESLFCPFASALHIFNLHGHLELLFIVFSFGTFAMAMSTNDGRSGFLGSWARSNTTIFMNFFFLFTSFCFHIECLLFQFHNLIL